MNDGFLKELGQAQPDSETIHFNEGYKDLLKLNNLQKLIDFISAPTEDSYRSVPERLTVGIDLIGPEESKVRVYLKRHWCEKAGATDKPCKEAVSEWDNLRELAQQGIQVPDALAVGWGNIKGHAVAFVMMKEVPGTQADHFIEENFNDPSDPALVDFMEKLAIFSAKFHKLGYNHRDFYLCHTFVQNMKDGYLFHLIDLQRVQKHNLFKKRWIVKDLAQMNYSAFHLVSAEGRQKFYETWCRETGKNSKTLLSAVERKTETMLKREKLGKVR